MVNLLLLPQFALHALGNTQPPMAISNIGGSHRKHPISKVTHRHLHEAALLSSDWDSIGAQVANGTCFSAYLQPDLSDDPGSLTVTDVEPHFLKAKLDADPDSPSYREVTCGPHQNKWYDAMELEVDTL